MSSNISAPQMQPAVIPVSPVQQPQPANTFATNLGQMATNMGGPATDTFQLSQPAPVVAAPPPPPPQETKNSKEGGKDSKNDNKTESKSSSNNNDKSNDKDGKSNNNAGNAGNAGSAKSAAPAAPAPVAQPAAMAPAAVPAGGAAPAGTRQIVILPQNMVQPPAAQAQPQAQPVQPAAQPQSQTQAVPPATQQPPAANGIRPRINDTSRVTVAEIDSFVTQANGFNHGEEIAKTIRAGGFDPSLAGKVDLPPDLQFHVDGAGRSDDTLARNTAAALQQILQRVDNGEDIDAVNMSLQDFNPSAGAGQVRQLIDELTRRNVGVFVAAGNEGINQLNQLVNPNAFAVQSARRDANGDLRLNRSSGPGNIVGESSSTSFATANLAPVLAAQLNNGKSVQDLRSVFGLPPSLQA